MIPTGAVADVIGDDLEGRADLSRSASEQVDMAVSVARVTGMPQGDVGVIAEAVWLGEWAISIPNIVDTPPPALAARGARRAGLTAAAALLVHAGWLPHLDTTDPLTAHVRQSVPMPDGGSWQRRAALYTLVSTLRGGMPAWGDAAAVLERAHRAWGRHSTRAQAIADTVALDIVPAQELLLRAHEREVLAQEWSWVLEGP